MNFLYTVFFLSYFAFTTSIVFAQNTYYQTTELETSDDELKTLINDRYKTANNIICDNCSKSESQFVKSVLESQKKAALGFLNDGRLILSGPLYEFVQDIYKRILINNPTLSEKKVVLIRDESLNAFTMGQDIIYIHTGLLYHLQNEDQLAFIICHEFAHDVLEHGVKKITHIIEKRADKEYQQKVNQTMAKKYGVVSELNKLVLPSLMLTFEMSRNFEFEADSLGILYFSNTDFKIENGCTGIDVFMNFDDLNDTTELNLVELLHLSADVVNMNKISKTKSSSSLGDFVEDEYNVAYRDSLNALLSTHPHGIERSIRLYDLMSLEIPEEFNTTVDQEYQKIFYWASGEMIHSKFFTNNIGKALLYALDMQRTYPKDKYAEITTVLSFYMMYYYKRKFKQGDILALESPMHHPVYDKLLQFCKKLSPQECYDIAINLEGHYDLDSQFIEYDILSLFKFYKELKNDEFKLLYASTSELLKKTVYWSVVEKMYKEVCLRK
jgi:Zn-dependent protease with chaperone function